MNYKVFLFILSAALLSFVVSVDDVYKCADNLKLDTCFLKLSGDQGNTYYVSACGKGKDCVQVGESFKCVKRAYLLEEGDKCEVDSECKTLHCTSNKCSYVSDNGDCKVSNECGLNSSCRSGKCLAMIEEGGACTGADADAQCKTGLVCGSTTAGGSNTCIKKFSVADGSYASTSSLCKSSEIKGDKCTPDSTERKAEWDAYAEAYY